MMWNSLRKCQTHRKMKYEVLTSIEKDVENYETKAKPCIEANDGVIKRAETLLSNTQALQAIQTQSSTANVGQWEEFRPQSNLEPTYLDKEANHLEVSQFCQNLRTYINVGF